jgi:hypothetical protein
MPLFSVIIPTYNRAGLIGQTLDSLLAQQDFPRDELEIIVVDDGSTDNTPEVLKPYQQQHGVIVVRQLNRGEGAARNSGFQYATGDYIANLDSDDLWFPWTARTYRDAIEQYNRPALVTGKQHEFRDPSELANVTAAPMNVEVFPDYYAGYDGWRFYGTSSFVIRREIAIAVGGFPGGWGVAEDADMGMKLGVAPGFVHFLAPATFAYRIHGGNIMNNMGRVYVGTSLLVDHEKGGHYPGGPSRRRQRRAIITRHIRACSLGCVHRGNSEMAWDMYWRTFGWHLRMGRLKYLAGFPVQAMAARFRRGKQS